MLIVLILPSILFPPKPDRRTGGRAVGDTAPGAARGPAAPPAPAGPEAVTEAPASPQSGCPAVRPSSSAAAETVWVVSPRVRFGFSTAGAQLLSAELLDYKSFAPGDSSRPVQLVPAGRPLLAHCLVVGADTISLADWRFTPSVTALRVQRDSAPLTFTAERGGARVTLAYLFSPDEYHFQVRGHVTGLGPAGAVPLVGLGEGLRSVGGDTMGEFRHFPAGPKAAEKQKTAVQALKPRKVKGLRGARARAGPKSKDFL